MNEKEKKKAIFYAIVAAALYAMSSPVSKLLLVKIPAIMMAALLYLGAGIGMTVLLIVRKAAGQELKEQPLTKKELPYTIGMILFDVAAPIFLMTGLKLTSAANVSLLNNFEIAATSLIALFLFGEEISKRLWAAIGLVTVSSMILSVEDVGSLDFSLGSVFVLAACVCWGFENNCTRKMSAKDPLQIVVIKGFCSGLSSLVIALAVGQTSANMLLIIFALLLGFVAYGLSIFFYVSAQRYLGAAKTSTYYAVAPFIGVVLSLIIFAQFPPVSFWIALILMTAGTYFASTDRKSS